MIDFHPSEDEAGEIRSWLGDFNRAENASFWASLENGAEHPFFIAIRAPGGKVSGGLEGVILHHWLKITIMAVRPEKRNRGLGRSLVAAAEKLALERGCLYSYVDTLSYQAPGFYEKLGYRECGRLRDWDSHGHDKIFFTKTLEDRR